MRQVFSGWGVAAETKSSSYDMESAAAGYAGKKIKDGITKQRGKTTKSEIEASISESEESFKKVISDKFNDFFEKSYDALKQILRNREEQLYYATMEW